MKGQGRVNPPFHNNERVSDAPLSLSVFLVLFNHTGPFLEKRLEVKKFRAPLLERGAPGERGGNVKIVAYLNCLIFFLLFFFCDLRFFIYFLCLLTQTN